MKGDKHVEEEEKNKIRRRQKKKKLKLKLRLKFKFKFKVVAGPLIVAFLTTSPSGPPIDELSSMSIVNTGHKEQ